MSEQIPVNERVEGERPPESPRPVPPVPPRPYHPRPERPYRSLFWPLILIGVGALWLLSNMGVISGANLSVLARLWPILLIAIGLDVLFARRSPLLGALIGLAAVGGIVALVIIGPQLGLDTDANFVLGSPEVQHTEWSEPLGNTTQADISLDLSSGPATLYALTDSQNLVDADIYYVGTMDFVATGGPTKDISISESRPPSVGIQLGMQEVPWDIGLSPEVPIALYVDGASGRVMADLDELTLSDFDYEGGSGSAEIYLPASDFESSVNVASGSVRLDIPSGAVTIMELEGGSGSLRVVVGDADAEFTVDTASGSTVFEVPSGAALRVEVEDDGSGSLNLPGWLNMVDDMDDDERDTGIWQSDGYENASQQITIIIEDAGSGSITVR